MIIIRIINVQSYLEKTVKTSIKLFLAALSWAVVPAFGHDHDQLSDQPDALLMFAFLMLSVLISTAALSYQQSKNRKAALAVTAANEEHPETH
tara:strand:+ start:532 stop:810 length:279 start_codon:yes stop_codon:yes gene_type:complete